MTDYTYGFSEYPGGETLDAGTLRRRVDDEAEITTALLAVVVDPADREVVYTFADDLTQDEEDALDALVAAYEFETLAEVKARCIGECRAWLTVKLEHPAEDYGVRPEYPASSGKRWSLTVECRASWALVGAGRSGLSYPCVLRTCDGQDSLSCADQAAMLAFLEAMAAAFDGAMSDCDAAIQNICDATDKASAEAARDAYVGT